MKFGMQKMFIFILSMLTFVGCQSADTGGGVSTPSSSEKIKKLILAEMEERYDEEFEIVDFGYNKTYDCYEAGVQTDKTKDTVATEVSYYEDDGMYDEYYANIYCTELTNAFLSELELSGNTYIYTRFMVGISVSEESTMNYEEFQEYYNTDELITSIEVYYAHEGEDMDTLKAEIAAVLQSLDKSDCNVSLYLVSADELPEIKDYVTQHYRLYGVGGLLDDYEYDLLIKKREGEITSVEEAELLRDFKRGIKIW